MAKWNSPPIAKVYEALGAVADGRVTVVGPTTAQVVSSAHDKTYAVEWSEDLREITSNDNASFWQGYMGYPIIAVLLTLGTIDFDEAVAGWLGGVPWKELNARFRRDYDKAVDSVLAQVEARGGDRAQVTAEVERIFERLAALDLQRPARRKPPPGR